MNPPAYLVRIAWFLGIGTLLLVHPIAGAILGAGYLIAGSLCYKEATQ